MKNFLRFAFEKDMINTRNINDQKKPLQTLISKIHDILVISKITAFLKEISINIKIVILRAWVKNTRQSFKE